VYGNVKESPIPESTPYNPVSPYGVHKMMAEQLCQLYASRYGLSIAIVRLFSIYGEGLRKQLLWDACNKLSVGDTSFFGSGEEVRDWLHVSDAARLLYLASEQASALYTVVNGGCGKGVKVKDMLHCLCDAMNVEKELFFSSVPKDGDPDVLLANVKSLEGWGFKASKDCSKGVSEYAQWYKKCH